MAQKVERVRRIGEQMRRELAQIVSTVVDHPHASMLSFTNVRVTRDLSFAKVYVTHVLASPTERETLVQALNDCAKQFRHCLAQRMALRKIPALTFYYDTSIEHGAYMESMLENLVKDLPKDRID